MPRVTQQSAPASPAWDVANIEPADLDIAVFTAQIALLNRQRGIIPINLLIAGFVISAVWRLYPVWVLVLWSGSFCIVILVRCVLRYRYRRQPEDDEAARRWARAFVLAAAVTGCMWGLTSSVIWVTSEPIYHIFILLVLAGMLAGGVIGNAAYLPAMLAFMLPAIIPAIVALFTRFEVFQTELGFMLMAYTVVLAIGGREINNTVIESLRLRFGHDVLLTKLRASEAAMAEAQAMAHIGNWEFDPRTKWIGWSAELYRIFGVNPTTALPSYETMLSRVHPDDHLAVVKAIPPLPDFPTGCPIDHRIVMDDGSIKWIQQSIRTTRNAEGGLSRLMGIVQDITARRSAEAQLQLANVLLTTEMEASPDGILAVDTNRNVISFNRRFSDMWQIPAATLQAGHDDVVLAGTLRLVKDPQGFTALVKDLYDHPGKTSHDEIETTDHRFIERHTVTLQSPAADYLGRVWFFRDITQRKKAEELAIRMARNDVLTGLVNREVFVEELRHAIAKSKRGDNGFAVIYFDLDHFKDVNDTLGHPVGDELLKTVADRIRTNTREADTISRFGGDEFAVIVSKIGEPADAAIFANKLIKAINEPYSIQGNDIHTGASVGIDLYGPNASDPETLLSHADVALYRAKSDGRGVYRFFTDAMDIEVRARVRVGEELREALDSGQLFLLYQPQVEIEGGRITGLEALVRWRHPTRGILGPEMFIPIAESVGIIGKLGHWVLWTACRQGKAWLDAGILPIRICVNVSGLQFKAPLSLETDVTTALAGTGLPAELLELELTESVLMDVSREHSAVLERLRKIGIAIAIDDFGTGYSSLGYLRRFPADRIKIAQVFVKHLATNAGDAAIVRATIGLAHELGIMVIAEGVETPEQLALLKEWGCAEVQGFHMARPLAVEKIAPLLRDAAPLGNQSRPTTSPDRGSIC
jgi:diguanylate cyclase (GGDEF)-like protein/PAS domain S-box-containing protein